MNSFLDILASGAESLSFRKRVSNYQNYKRKVPLRKPKTPEEILREAWEDVGNRMWNAVGVAKKEYGR